MSHANAEISDLLRELQRQLTRSQETRENEGLPPLFQLQDMTVEVQFTAVRDDNVEGKIGIHVLQAGGSSKIVESTVHRVTIHLTVNQPIESPTKDGQPEDPLQARRLRGSFPSQEMEAL